MDQKSKQSVLSGNDINQLISLTFDERADIRLAAAKRLERFIDDPRCLFAMIELTSDKNILVGDYAKSVLERVGGLNSKAVNDLQVIFAETTKEKKSASATQSMRERILPKIDELFADSDTGRKQKFKESIIPTLDFFISREMVSRVGAGARRAAEAATPLKSIGEPDIAAELPPPKVDLPIEQIEPHARAIVQQGKDTRIEAELDGVQLSPRDSISMRQQVDSIDSPHKHAEILENIDSIGSFALPDKVEKLPMFKFAYELVSSGLGRKELALERKRIVVNFKKEVDLAFQVAIARFEHSRYVSISDMTEGMKRIDTEELMVLSVGNVMGKSGKKVQYVKIVAGDGRAQVAIALPVEKGEGIRQGDIIQLARAELKRINGELALTIRKNSKVSVFR
ncbi:hypothetical protein COT30_01215 [Candidatus Micrarchaeota archaeon CG08_land_8_20_14_0_20_49_17]|nr:MAG: hypothetical protein AUJ13_06065 [Candidatus Micrarchaeota archaeon CG1_02_49_24]PIU10065.1 MAG: hypothetical protein COT30_01215 [Candidatus Micrarchaeota archaeon CG08_land_8_20_14_0_20_49_17]PIU82447.1 MAG: hypothetical protein COS70_01265 [Candidatus Micrarchaeota archaeon CG06_land_8_20_14_3_00_50_6]HII54014.1 hypothetical protein [Candidatus Micrarchaeota archaeon]